MITPYERLIELEVPSKANYRCLELSPDGTMVVAVTVNTVEIWSYRSNITLLAALRQSRPTGYSKALLNRLFVLWNSESNRFVVIRSEGIVDFYTVELKQKIQEDVYEEQYSPINYVSATVKKVGSTSIEQYGYPISTCTIKDKIIIATDSNNIAEVNWNGDCMGCHVSRFVPPSHENSTLQVQDRSILSVSACPELSCLAVALDDNSCYLFEMASSIPLPVNITTVSLEIPDGIRQILFCPGLPLLAVTSTRLSLDFYDIKRTADSFELIHRHSIDIRQYPQVNSSPLFAYDSIVSMCWAPGKPYLAIGLKYQGLMVWGVGGDMNYAYNKTPDQNSESLENTVEVSCCCFSLDSSRLLFNIPYGEIHKDKQENIITVTSHMFCQQFVITADLIHSVENCSFFGYTTSSLIQLANATGCTRSVLPSVHPIPADFTSRDEFIRGMEVSPSGKNVLLFTPSSLCIFTSSRGKWSTATNFVPNGFITAGCWITDYIFLVAVSPKTLSRPGAILYAVNINYLSLTQAIQEIEVHFSGASDYRPSLQDLLPTTIPSSSFPFIQSLHCQENFILCSTCSGLFYLFSIDTSLESFNASTKHLPVSFISKGTIRENLPLRYGCILSTPREVLLEDGETTEILCNDILAVYWDQSVTLVHLTEEAENDVLFSHVDQIILCQHQDRGVIHNPMNIDHFLLFIVENQQTAWFPAYERVPSTCTSSKNTMIPSQTVGGTWGFSWSKCALITLMHCGDDVRPAGEKNWLQPIVVCCYHLLIAELLHANQLAVASAYLQLGVSLKLPGFISSLEYLLHYAINNDNSSFLAICLQLLSQLPYYSRILVRCLRKQERSMWPFAVQKTEDIIQLFHTFLFTNDMEYSITTISILHGLLCSVIQNGETECEIIPISTWQKHIKTEETWLFEDYAEIFTGEIEHECPAHLNGLQLLLVCVMKHHFALLADIYRYLVMEETRHKESGKEIPEEHQVNEVLSWVCYILFKKGHLDVLYGVVKNVEFTWTIQPASMRVDDYVAFLHTILQGSHWEMKKRIEQEEEVLVSCPTADALLTEEAMNDLLRCLMLAGFAEWSLLLMLLLLKSKQLTNFALARNDIWIRCIHDFSKSSDDHMKEFLGFVQHEVEERRKEFYDVC